MMDSIVINQSGICLFILKKSYHLKMFRYQKLHLICAEMYC